jgi:hypothetical protein
VQCQEQTRLWRGLQMAQQIPQLNMNDDEDEDDDPPPSNLC